jgi:hypothetical protein
MWLDEYDEEERDRILDALEENQRRLEEGHVTPAQFWDNAVEIAFDDPEAQAGAREWIREFEESGYLDTLMLAARLELDVPPARPGDN